jgi:hypothetical protein
MNVLRLALIILAAITASAPAQVVLNTGDVFTYSFKSLPDLGPGSCSGAAPTGGFTLNLSPDSFNAGDDVLFVEIFEHDTKESPLTTFVAESFADGIALPDAWADLQGAVRFTMLSGSAILQNLTFFRRTPIDADTCHRYGFTVVPSAPPAPKRTLITIQGTLTQNSENGQLVQLGASVSGQTLDSLEFAPVNGDGSLKSTNPSRAAKASSLALCHFNLEGEVIREDQLITLRGLVQSSPDRRLLGARVVISADFSEGSNEQTGISLFFYVHPDTAQPPLEFYGQGFVTAREVGPN